MGIIRTTDRQTEANRLNAQKSTGPRTAEGKARSRQNATKHGLTAKIPLLPGEDPAELEAFLDALSDDLAPEGVLESALVQRIGDILWRQRRVPHFEAGLMTYIAAHEAYRHDDEPYPDRANAEARERNETYPFRPPAIDDNYRLGRMFRQILDENQLSKLSRYEVAMQNQLKQALRDLSERQGERLRRAAQAERAEIEEAKPVAHDQPQTVPDVGQENVSNVGCADAAVPTDQDFETVCRDFWKQG